MHERISCKVFPLVKGTERRWFVSSKYGGGLASSRTGKAGKRGNLPAQTLRPDLWSAAGSLGPLWAQLMPGTPTKNFTKKEEKT